MNYDRIVMPNGLRVFTVPMPSFASATVLVMVGAGSRYENKKNNGISHFLEHMAFKGTEKRPSAMDIAGTIDGIGGEFNAFTGKEYTGYYIKAAAHNTELMVDILSDMLQHSKLDAAEIDKERGVIIEEINLYEDTPPRKIGEVYEQALYGDTPLGWDIAGTKENIQAITREDFKSYMGSFYSPSNMTLIVAGGITKDSVYPLIEKYFSPMQKFDYGTYEKVQESQTKPNVLLKKKDTEQAHFAMGVRTVPLNHPDKHALSVLAAVLGGGMSSRMFHEIRERRGLAYYVRSNSEHYLDAGSLVSTAGVDPKRVEEAIKVMREEYEKIKSAVKVTPEELKKAKEFLKGHLVLELEDSRSVAAFFAEEELLEDKVHTPEQIIQEIDSVTQDKINEIASKYIQESTLNLAIIGNFEDASSFEQLLV